MQIKKHKRVTSDVSDYIAQQKQIEAEKEEYRKKRARELKAEADSYRFQQLKAYSNQQSPSIVTTPSVKMRMNSKRVASGMQLLPKKKQYGIVSLESGWVQ